MQKLHVFLNIHNKSFINLLKVDCEGSEYPILYTSNMLKYIKTIVMEIHSFKNLPKSLNVEGFTRYNSDGIVKHLKNNGFKCDYKTVRGGDNIWRFIKG